MRCEPLEYTWGDSCLRCGDKPCACVFPDREDEEYELWRDDRVIRGEA